MAGFVQARLLVIRIGWILAFYLALVVAQLQGWIDLPTWLYWVLGVPVFLLAVLVVAGWVLQRVLARRFRRMVEEASQHMRAWQGQGDVVEGDVVEGEVVEDDGLDEDGPYHDDPAARPRPERDLPVRIPVEDPDE